MCRKFFPDNTEALEVLNDGMLKVFRNIHQFSADKGQFFNWVYTIVRRAALDRLRTGKWETHASVDDLQLPDSRPASANIEWKDTYTLLDVLPPSTRAVCILFYIEGFAVSEISEQLGISTGTVKWHLSESRTRLKPVLQKYFS